MILFLTREEVIELTAYKNKSRQVSFLLENGLRYVVASDGHPKVYRSQFEHPEKEKQIEPDFSSLDDWNTK